MRTFLCLMAMCMAILTVGTVHAEEGGAPVTNLAAMIEDVEVSVGVDYTTQYFDRGILQEDEGLIVQPWVEATFPLTDEFFGFDNVKLTLGNWNSINDNNTGATDSPDNWFKSDLYMQLEADIGDRIGVATRYTYETSPSDAFSDLNEISVSSSYNDANHWGEDFDGLKPYVLIAFELGDNGLDGGREGIYGELGINPSFTLVESLPVELSIPVTLGLNLDGYYEAGAVGGEDVFGYLDIGGELSTPLSFVPGSVGAWKLHGGIHYLILGNDADDFNGGEGDEWIGTIGVSASF